jgi:sirohydrochlorin ferrochelatase
MLSAPKTAIIVSHGQPSQPSRAEKTLSELAIRIAAHLPDWNIASATMAAKGSLESQLDRLPNAVLFPLFMADGWFTGTALPARLIGQRIILPPLGLDPALPELADFILRAEINNRGWEISETEIVIAGHGGQNSTNPAKATQSFATALTSLLPVKKIEIGFVEEAPFLNDMARGSGSKSLCLPFFAAKGLHVRQDIPELFEQAGYTGELLDPIGLAPQIPNLIAKSIRTAHQQQDAA